MKNIPTPHRRAFAALIPATLMLAAPALAQEVAPATPPPTQTAPAPEPAAPALQASANPAPTPLTNGVTASKGIGDPNSATPIAPEAYAQAEEARAARAPAPRTVPRTAARRPAPAAPRETIPAGAPVAAAPAAAPMADVPAAAPAPAASAAPTQADATAPAQADTADTADTAATDTATATTDQPAPIWPWIVGGLVLLAGLAALFLRRRNRVEEYDEVYEEPVAVEPTYVEPVARAAAEPAVIAPVAPIAQTQTQMQSATQTGRLQPTLLRSAPIAAAAVAAAASSVEDKAEAVEVEAELAEPEAEEVAALTASGQHADRPWLEFAMRPVRAGSTSDDALVEIELTVGNSGAVAAQGVRISTFMFADGSASQGEMERLLTDRAGDSEVAPVTIEPGEGTRVDATLSLSKERLGDEVRTFNPVIVADARYRLADGSEGRTSASFTIGMISAEDDDLRGIAIHRPHMIDDIEARLHGVPAHA